MVGLVTLVEAWNWECSPSLLCAYAHVTSMPSFQIISESTAPANMGKDAVLRWSCSKSEPGDYDNNAATWLQLILLPQLRQML